LLVVVEAQDGDISGIVVAAVLPVDDVMQIQPSRRAAALDGASSAVALHHQPARRRRDVRLGTLGLLGVERADVVRVARRTIDRGRRQLDLPPAAELPATPAVLADRDGDLVRRPRFGNSALGFEAAPAQDRQERIIIEVLAVLVGQRGPSLAQQRVGVGGDILERDPAQPELRGRSLIGRVAVTAAADQLLDLAQVLATRLIEPRVLVLARGHAGQLANRAVPERAVAERVFNLGQVAERACHSHAIARIARAITELAL